MASAPAADASPAACRRCRRRSTKPLRARSIAGLSNSASVNLPEPYFSSASANPATRAGNADAERGIARLGVVGLAVRPREICRRGRGRRRLAIIDRDVLVAFGRMDHHEAAAADIAGARIGHGHGKAGRDRRIDRIAAAPQDVGADPRRDFLLRHHHAVFGGDGMNGVGGWRRIEAAALLLRGRRACQHARTSSTRRGSGAASA